MNAVISTYRNFKQARMDIGNMSANSRVYSNIAPPFQVHFQDSGRP